MRRDDSDSFMYHGLSALLKRGRPILSGYQATQLGYRATHAICLIRLGFHDLYYLFEDNERLNANAVQSKGPGAQLGFIVAYPV